MKSRIFGLDLLRAYAILCVVYEHGYLFVADKIQEKTYKIPVIDGVTIFFVLSGFLIGRILLKTISKTDFNIEILCNFWARRWLRTLPSYLLVLSIVVFYSWIKYGFLPADLYKYYIFSQNLFSSHPSFYGEAWSLSVEEWFYLAAPLSIFFLLKCAIGDRNKSILAWIIFCIVFATAIRNYSIYKYGAMDLGVWDTDFRKVVVMRLDSLMIGVSAAYFALFYRKTWDFYSKTAIIFGLAILLLHKLLDEDLLYHKYFGITTSSLGVFLLLPYLSTMHCNRRIALMVVTHISVISYSMYLINYTVIRDISIPFIMKELSSVIVLPYSIKADLAYTLYWIATIAGAHFLTKYYEIPMLSIRDKLWPPPIHGIKDAHEGGALRNF